LCRFRQINLCIAGTISHLSGFRKEVGVCTLGTLPHLRIFSKEIEVSLKRRLIYILVEPFLSSVALKEWRMNYVLFDTFLKFKDLFVWPVPQF
jgi:hypothetical protein